MIIRQKQADEFSRRRLQDFEDRAFAHLREFWPRKCAEVGEPSARRSVHDAIRRAASYGITTERDVILFLNHMYMLSPDFDTNPDFPWASEILNDLSIAPASKMNWLSGRTYHRLGDQAPKEP